MRKVLGTVLGADERPTNGTCYSIDATASAIDAGDRGDVAKQTF